MHNRKIEKRKYWTVTMRLTIITVIFALNCPSPQSLGRNTKLRTTLFGVVDCSGVEVAAIWVLFHCHSLYLCYIVDSCESSIHNINTNVICHCLSNPIDSHSRSRIIAHIAPIFGVFAKPADSKLGIFNFDNCYHFS